MCFLVFLETPDVQKMCWMTVPPCLLLTAQSANSFGFLITSETVAMEKITTLQDKVSSLDVSQWTNNQNKLYSEVSVHIKECRSSRFRWALSPSERSLGAMGRFAPSGERSAWCGRLGPDGQRAAADPGAAPSAPVSPRSAQRTQQKHPKRRTQRRKPEKKKLSASARIRRRGPELQERWWDRQGGLDHQRPGDQQAFKLGQGTN